MTLEDLEQIFYMKSEVEVLCRRLKKCVGNNYVADYAKDYSDGYGRVITIRGYSVPDTDKVNEITSILDKKKRELEEKIIEAELYVNSLPDSKMRTLLRLHFLEGCGWDETAAVFKGKMTADSARMCVTRFFEKK